MGSEKLEVLVHENTFFIAYPTFSSYSYSLGNKSLLEANSNFEQGNYEMALLCYRQALRIGKGIPLDSLNLQGVCCNLISLRASLDGDLNRAIKYSKKAASLLEFYLANLNDINAIRGMPENVIDNKMDIGFENLAIAYLNRGVNLKKLENTEYKDEFYPQECINVGLHLVDRLLKRNSAESFLLHETALKLLEFGDLLDYEKKLKMYSKAFYYAKKINVKSDFGIIFDIKGLKMKIVKTIASETSLNRSKISKAA